VNLTLHDKAALTYKFRAAWRAVSLWVLHTVFLTISLMLNLWKHLHSLTQVSNLRATLHCRMLDQR